MERRPNENHILSRPMQLGTAEFSRLELVRRMGGEGRTEVENGRDDGAVTQLTQGRIYRIYGDVIR